MILIYTGTGKGKTSAAIGQAIRALGRGFTVSFCQFLKREGQAGEQEVLKGLLGDRFLAGGKGFLRDPSRFQEHRQAARNVLDWARTALEATQGPAMLVLDEALYALDSGLVARGELEGLMEMAGRAEKLPHLVLTGRGLPDWLSDRADLITEMTLVKHPFEQGVKAQEGIEY